MDEHREALAGDLLEDFRYGRTVAWYWRQVLAAICIGRLGQLRAGLSAILFAALWSALSPALLFFQIQLIENERLMEHFRQLASPWFTICKGGLEIAAYFFTLWLGLTVYAALHAWAGRGLNYRKFTSGLLMTVPMFLQMWMAVAAVTLVVATVFPQRVFDLDWPRTTLLRQVLGMAMSPSSIVSFCTMVPAIFTCLPERGLETPVGPSVGRLESPYAATPWQSGGTTARSDVGCGHGGDRVCQCRHRCLAGLPTAH